MHLNAQLGRRVHQLFTMVDDTTGCRIRRGETGKRRRERLTFVALGDAATDTYARAMRSGAGAGHGPRVEPNGCLGARLGTLIPRRGGRSPGGGEHGRSKPATVRTPGVPDADRRGRCGDRTGRRPCSRRGPAGRRGGSELERPCADLRCLVAGHHERARRLRGTRPDAYSVAQGVSDLMPGGVAADGADVHAELRSTTSIPSPKSRSCCWSRRSPRASTPTSRP